MASAVAIRREARREEIERERELAENEHEENEALSGETAVANISATPVIGTRKRPRQLKHEDIAGFHARVTSEDNAEFETNQEIESKQREINLGIIYSSAADKSGRLAIEAAINGKALPHDTNRALLGCDTPLGLASDLYNASPSAGLRITGDDKKKNTNGIGRNGLFFQPQHIDEKVQTQTGQLMLESSATAAAPSTGNFLALTNDESTNDNLLMPPPPARQSETLCISSSKDTYKASQSNNSLLNTYHLVEYQPKPLIPHINPPATRFPEQGESRLAASNATRHLTRGSDGETSDATTDLDSVAPSLDEERAARRRAKMREHETFVPMTPLIQPGGDGSLDEPMMTWGTVASTPLVLGNGAAVDKDWEPTQPFTSGTESDNFGGGIEFDVVEENDRQKLAHRAEKKLFNRSKAYKSAGSKALINDAMKKSDVDDSSTASMVSSKASLSTARSGIDRSASLTPAARALLEANTKSIESKNKSHSHMKLSSRIFQPSPVSSSLSAASRSSFGSALRMSYTPSSAPSTIKKRKARGGKPSSMLRRAAEGSTPRIER